MKNRLAVIVTYLRERLWIKPLVMCIVSVAVVFGIQAADQGRAPGVVPDVSAGTIEALLKVMASSMLVIATFAVGSMVSSYASVSRTATPRGFALAVSDDVSQNALSSFVGAFIFSIVALVALMNEFYGSGGRFALFCATLLVFAGVILMFLRWVDRIARLGRLGTTIEKVEHTTAKAFVKRRRQSTLGGVRADSCQSAGQPVYAEAVGYVQRVDVSKLQGYAEETNQHIRLVALPGTLCVPGRPVALVRGDGAGSVTLDEDRLLSAFQIDDDRSFDDDPRFGLVVLSQIAARALSPAVNDPGTAIDILGTFVRLFVLWNDPVERDDMTECEFDRVEVPELSMKDMFDDAFTGIARDGAGMVEVGIRLQKALGALASVEDVEMRQAARSHARTALARAEQALALPADLDAVRQEAAFALP